MDGEAKRNNIESIERLNCLNDNEFRVFIMSVHRFTVRSTLKTTRNLFTYQLTEDQSYYKIIDTIVTKLGGIDECERIAEQMLDAIPTTDKIRETLDIEPFEYHEPVIAVTRNML